MSPTREQMIDFASHEPGIDPAAAPRPDDFDDRLDRVVARVQAGEGGLFAELYRLCFEPVYSYLRLVLNDEHEAEDLTQQVFLKVFEGLPAYEARPGKPFRAWLFIVVRNHALSWFRKHNRLDPEDPAQLTGRRERDLPTASGLNALTWVTDADLLTFIEHMPLVQRQVLLLRFMLDLSAGQTAAILDRSPAAVRKIQHTALKFLRARLISIGREPQPGNRSGWRRRTTQVVVLRERRHALKP